MKVPKIIWLPTGKKIKGDLDILAIPEGGYLLRIEKMDRFRYWWAVYYREEEVAFENILAQTPEQAKIFTEFYFLKHWIKRQ